MATGWKRVKWTAARREKFFDHLAGSCNVRASAEAAGVDPASAYAMRRKDSDFAADWQTALLAGYAVLETAVVGYAMAAEKERAVDGPFGRVDIDTALRLLSAHRNALNGKAYRGGPPLRRATREETDTALLKQIEMIEKARKAGVA